MKYILITGGGLSNKGAAAMLFATVDEVKKRFPKHEVAVLSNNDFRNKSDIDQVYNFEIIPDIIRYKFAFGLYSKFKNINKNELEKAEIILENTEKVIDISGYAIGSNWSLISQLLYLSKIKILKQYNIQTYLMPQSFGPFNYNGLIKSYMNKQIEKHFKYCKVIFAREKEGFDYLVNVFKLKNVILSPDLVLLNKGVELNNIFITNPNVRKINIKKNSVAIIPNSKTIEHGNEIEILKIYELAINKLLSKDYTVYIMRHSSEDIDICKTIKERFLDNESVVLLSDNFSTFEYNEIVKQMNFIIASRYHSIVHSYKNYTPCIALGWATKYHVLLKMFDQNNYIFDVRKDIDSDQFLFVINQMLNGYILESNKVKLVLNEIQQKNIFDVLEDSNETDS